MSSIHSLINYAGKPDAIEVLDCDGLGERVALIYDTRVHHHFDNGLPFNRQTTRDQLGLTPMDRQVITYLAQGLSPKQTAQALGITRTAVYNHLYLVRNILGISSLNNIIKVVCGKEDG